MGFSSLTDAQKTLFDTQVLAFLTAKTAACTTEAKALDFIECDKADDLRAYVMTKQLLTSNQATNYYLLSKGEQDAEDLLIANARTIKKKEFVDSKAAADQAAADKAAIDKAAADKAAEDKAAADKAAADKAASDKAAADAAKLLEKPICEDAGVLLAKEKLVPLQAAINSAKEQFDKIKKDYAVAGVESSYSIEEKVKAVKVHADALDQKNIVDGKTEAVW